jgi:protease-3
MNLISHYTLHTEVTTTMKNTITKLSALLLLVSHITTSATINKNLNDPRSYESFVLDNGMQVVTVSDNNIRLSAATLSIGVGQYQDPISHQGLAHFLEHMIFLGSQQYPEPGEFVSFVSSNGGEANAFTAQNQTTYLFSIDSKQFEPALSRLGSAIKAPLFDKAMIDKEINAVNSEWLTLHQSDQFIMQRVIAQTGNKNHPKVQLGVGNLDTLNKDKSGLLAALKKFHQHYYSANIMKLVLVGNQSHKTLRAIATKYFSTLNNNNIERPSTNEAPYNKEHLKQHIFVKSNAKHPALSMEFVIDNNISDWQNKTNVYLAQLLSSEEDGSLIASLREQGLIQTAIISILPNIWGNSGSAFIDFLLTDKGQANKKNIVSHTFAYIELLKTGGINKAYADELRGLLALESESFITPNPLQLAIELSQVIYDYPTQHLMDHRYMFTDFQPEKIKQMLAKFTPENLRIYHVSPQETADIPLTYADGSYRTVNITSKESNQWTELNTALKLPKVEIVKQEKNTIIELDENFTSPKKIHQAAGVQVFFSQSLLRKRKEGLINIALAPDVAKMDVNYRVGTSLLNLIFSKQNTRFKQRAQKRKGITVFQTLNTSANPLFVLVGRSNNQLALANQLLQNFIKMEIDQNDFDNAYDLYKNSMDSLTELKLDQQLGYYAANMTKRPPNLYTRKTELAALERINVDSLKDLHQEILKNSYIDIYAHGNFEPKALVAFANENRSRLGENEIKRTYLETDFKPKADTAKIKRIAVTKNGVGIRDTYVYPKKSYKVIAQLNVLNRLMSTSFFNDLRTNKQLGYLVNSFIDNIHEYPAISMQIVSDNTDLQTLKEKIMHFQVSFFQALKNIDESSITQLTASMVEEMSRTPDNIFVEVSPLLLDWEFNKHNFNSHKKNIEYIKNTSKDDLVKLYKEMMIDGNYMNLVVQLKGENFKDTEYFSFANFAKHE